MEPQPTPWKYEPEFYSQERRKKTGSFYIRDSKDGYICKVIDEDLAKKICAMPEMIELVYQLLDDAVRKSAQEHRVTNYTINMALAVKKRLP